MRRAIFIAGDGKFSTLAKYHKPVLVKIEIPEKYSDKLVNLDQLFGYKRK